MGRKTKKTENRRSIETYEHRDKERVNNPPVGLVTPETDPDAGQKKKTYAYDPHLDPQLVWAGKAEHTSFEVPTVSLHVHERIDPRTIIKAVRKRNGNGQLVQVPLFEKERKEPLRDAIQFYQHKHGWTNRLIAGDSLLVMNSLLEKEGMAGKVQMIYIDPPYGIKYSSNFQPFVNKRDVKDGKDEDLTSEPEQIRAFRDTWELGIHSYLTYLRDRLLLARELLAESGSCFVQISDENVHHVRELMDEVFGVSNFVSLITFKKSGSQTAAAVPTVGDYLVWYCRDKPSLKFRPLYKEKGIGLESTEFRQVLLPDGTYRTLTREELIGYTSLPRGSRVFKSTDLHSRSGSESTTRPYEFQGKTYRPRDNAGWRTTAEGLMNLENAGRLLATGNSLRYVHFFDDFPYSGVASIWDDVMGEANIVYVVQTNQKVIQRCLLMTTDPGDLVFDPTCGSGTTAYVAEQWGRRWITCDTSRVALTIARQRLMTAVFDYYELAHPQEGVGSGFKYKTVPHITLKSIANNPEIDGIYARWQTKLEPIREQLNRVVSGQWTVDSEQGIVDDKEKTKGKKLSTNHQPLTSMQEWEIPREAPDDWPEEAKRLLGEWWQMRRKRQEEIDAAIARHAPQETLYDQPFVDRRKVRVTGPFTVEAVPAPAVKSVDSVLGTVESGQNADPAQAIHSQLTTIHYADSSVARSGETLRQAQWRDELLKTGIRGKNGQYIRFARLEPLPGCRWLHADGEVAASDQGIVDGKKASGGEKLSTSHNPLSTNRIVVSFGPEHGPLEQRQVEHAWEEARTLVPKPKLLVFAAFQFDPEAAKDIDEMKPELAGMQFLKVQMNADLLTDDLKKKRASNESFWLIGQPDVEVDSEEWIVNSRGEVLAPYDVVAKLSGVDRLAEINGLDRENLSFIIAIAQRRDLWSALATDTRGGVHSGEHRRGTGSSEYRRIPAVPGYCSRLPGRIGDAVDFVQELDTLTSRERQQRIERLRGNREIIERAHQIAATLTGPLSTVHYSQVTVHGFDYYNTKTGQLESGGADKIAVWLLDTDYDGRSLYPRQVFFPMAGEDEGWAKLARNLKAEIDEDLIEAYRGTVSLPFVAGEHGRIAVKIVDDRGIESLKVLELPE